MESFYELQISCFFLVGGIRPFVYLSIDRSVRRSVRPLIGLSVGSFVGPSWIQPRKYQRVFNSTLKVRFVHPKIPAKRNIVYGIYINSKRE